MEEKDVLGDGTHLELEQTQVAQHTAGVSQMDFTERAALGDYVILEPIGSGGMGEVFKAQHQRMERIVALKVLSATVVGDPLSVRRFHREVRAAAKLSHPNIVTAFDAGEQDDMHYLVMEYVDGFPLSELVKQNGPVSVGKAVDYVLQTARGLQHAHSLAVIHRDIKPSNLMLNSDGIIKILDMGLARFGDGTNTMASMHRLTQTGVMMGTMGYMSPEQLTDPSRVDHRTDIYSLGCTLYFLLTQRPVYGGNMVESIMGHTKEAIPSLCSAHDEVPEVLDAVFQRMLSKDPDQRYQTMSAVVADLERCHCDEPVSADPSSTRDLVATMRSSAEAIQDTVFKTTEESSTIAPHAPAVGIDFGTSVSAIGVMDEVGQPIRLTDSDGETETFSVVAIDGGEPKADLLSGPSIAVGLPVHQETSAQDRRIVSAIKRSLGRPGLHQFGDGGTYPPEVLAAMVLAKVINNANAHIGAFQDAVLAVPACFDDVQRKSLQDAASIAGIKRVSLVSESLAAAVAFAEQRGLLRGDSATAEPRRFLIYDLGGGVFDVSVVEISSARVCVLATEGDSELGGCDWDRCLLDWIAERCKKGHGPDPRLDDMAALSLLEKCEAAKHSLSTGEETEIVLEFQNKRLRAKIDRKRLQSLTADLLESTENLTRNVLKRSRLDWKQIDDVLLIGGGSKMPMVQDMIRRLSGKEPVSPRSSRELVVHGATLCSGAKLNRLSWPLEIQDVNSRQLGVVGRDKRTGSKRHAVMIPRNAPLPAIARQTFKIQKEGQGSLRVHIVQGNSDSPERCTSIGKLSIVGLPPELPVGTPVVVEFHLSTNGRLELSVPTDLIPTAKPLFTRDVGISSEQVNYWREWLETMSLCGQIE